MNCNFDGTNTLKVEVILAPGAADMEGTTTYNDGENCCGITLNVSTTADGNNDNNCDFTNATATASTYC